MGIGDAFNKAKDKVRGLASENPDKAENALNKAEETVSGRVPGQHADKVSQGFASAREKMGLGGDEGGGEAGAESGDTSHDESANARGDGEQNPDQRGN